MKLISLCNHTMVIMSDGGSEIRWWKMEISVPTTHTYILHTYHTIVSQMQNMEIAKLLSVVLIEIFKRLKTTPYVEVSTCRVPH